ncbi:16S rRNA (guanine(527)-N(7))-methyltransferase RsmG [Fusibacter tunisiensis]|jgi:16S rRNA (guanine527-N7)-methyltransferase|uniref:Ribosomal RNA small subunit methyltransferase G n=1 Tax=Fusibacter tunisiensis TaxID=1008308 RepID=A0ABS2MNM3_9FIRM|nr:16S rRNA (guanine(527)-N(7))-methyltransferase RsmG [Fusibacter tunisiensis]MBM7560997.1 16S rRNA (guanine527-N7)-methyltransferase [Fusibacter tunisiensis]
MIYDDFKDYNLELSEDQVRQFELFYEHLIRENEKYNLTAITQHEEVIIKHFLDSILCLSLGYDFKKSKIIDIGTGAGFPAIPLKIMVPDCHVTCLDALNKRVNFLKLSADVLKLSDMTYIHGRAEDFGQNSKYREVYDFAVSRAVAELRLLLEYVMPFVKPGGFFIAYKSLKSDDELNDAQNSIRLMQCELVKNVNIVLPKGYGTRDLLVFRKIGHISNKYPRKPGIPKKAPL